MEVALNHSALKYTGRIDFTNPQKPEMIFPSSMLRFRFWGKWATVVITNHRSYWKNSIGAVVDGSLRSYRLQDEGATEIVLFEEEIEKEHEILIFKKMDACHEIVVERLELSDGSRLLPLPKDTGRRIEIYGDSVSAGEVSEAVAYTGREDPVHNGEYSNSWYSYGWIAARMLGAELHNISQGGIALQNHTGWFLEPDYMGMEEVWDKIHYHPAYGKTLTWDFTQYTPQVVIVAIGQNDSHPTDYMKEDYFCDQAVCWRNKYKLFINRLRETYPNAHIILTTTILIHDFSWDKSIEEVCNELDDQKISHFLYRRNGTGTPGHIRIPEAEEMAQELVSYIQSLLAEGWE